MTFTYNLSGTGDTLAIARVRLRLRDVTEDSGVLPDGSNLSDEELLQLLDDNSDDVMATAAAAAEVVAAAWANAADITVGPRREALSQVAERWQKLAAQWRAQADTGSGFRIRKLTDYESTGSEYTAYD